MIHLNNKGEVIMAKLSTEALRAAAPTDTPIYPDDLEAAIQETLAMLADVDLEHEQRCEMLDRWSGSETQKERLRRELDTLHQRDREPMVLRLADLHYRMMRVTMFRTVH
jgi:hypothetical protein